MSLSILIKALIVQLVFSAILFPGFTIGIAVFNESQIGLALPWFLGVVLLPWPALSVLSGLRNRADGWQPRLSDWWSGFVAWAIGAFSLIAGLVVIALVFPAIGMSLEPYLNPNVVIQDNSRFDIASSIVFWLISVLLYGLKSAAIKSRILG